MSNLQQYQADISINQETGESFTSMRGLARICKVSPSTISEWATVRHFGVLEAEILTTQGLRTVRQFNENEIAEAVGEGIDTSLWVRYNKERLIYCLG